MSRRLPTPWQGGGVQDDDDVTVTVVSGLPRSGTSMMMKMLEAGGLDLVIDGERAADVDNPEGYYEFERVKKLPKGDHGWIEDAEGKGVKVISALLNHLPPTHEYRVIFMQRRLVEVLRSQQKMLANRDEAADQITDEEMQVLYDKHLKTTYAWLDAQPNVEVLYVDYNAMLKDPTALVPELNRFLGGRLDEDAMLHVVNPDLYRNRA
jgi:hypothetical protein